MSFYKELEEEKNKLMENIPPTFSSSTFKQKEREFVLNINNKLNEIQSKHSTSENILNNLLYGCFEEMSSYNDINQLQLLLTGLYKVNYLFPSFKEVEKKKFLDGLTKNLTENTINLKQMISILHR